MRVKRHGIMLALGVNEAAALDELASKSETSRTGIIRAALRLYYEVWKRARRRERIFIEAEDGTRAEVILISLIPRD